MKSNRRLKQLLIGAGVVLLAILAFYLFIYIFNVYHVSYSGDKGIVESKARQAFFWQHFPFEILPYGMIVNEKYDPFFQHHSLYLVSGNIGWISTGEAVIALGEDRRAYLLPDEFNEVVKGENITVDSDAEALRVANAYVNSSCVYGIGKLLYNASDIPGLSREDLLSLYNQTREYNDSTTYEERRMQRERMENVIAPPAVSLEEDGYAIDFYSWKSLMGVLEKWKVKVGKNGAITVINEKEIDSRIGSHFGLAL